MFINYIAIMLVNLTAGLGLAAYYILRGLDDADQRRWFPGFFAVGLVALATGFHMIFTWPLPGNVNIVFGESNVMFGAVYTAAAFAMLLERGAISVAFYAFFAGLYPIVAGARIISLQLTRSPYMSAAAFFLAGLGGVSLVLLSFMRENAMLRMICAAILALAMLLFAFTGYNAIWGHIADYAKWVPATLK